MEIVAYARKSLRALNVDQWQGDYPDRATFEDDIERGELYKLMHGGDLAASSCSPTARSRPTPTSPTASGAPTHPTASCTAAR
ncbi:MAG: hypothetical protein V8S87_09815 [Oscillospiraceae bacterium]